MTTVDEQRARGAGASSGPGVRFPPPLLFVAALALGWLIDRYVHAVALSPIVGGARVPTGGVLLGLGLVLSFWGMATFRGARTAIIPNRPASQLVSTGPYRFTRNPMYLGLTIATVGGAFLVDSAWPVALLPFALLVLVRTVIHREERYLRGAFGDAYVAYCARVRRFL